MKPIVPFVHSLTDSDSLAWAVALRAAAPDLDIRFAAEISPQERSLVAAAIVANPDPADLTAFPNLTWVQSLWAGVDRILREMPDDKVQIVRLIDPQLAETMAEAVLAWTLYLHRSMPAYAAQQAKRVWLQVDLPTASERTVGVLGLGHLGQQAARRLQQNGFNVLGWARSAKDIAGITTLNGTTGLHQIAAQSDILVLLLPSTPQTCGLIDADFIKTMKPGGSLINFARGDIVVRDDLIHAVTAGQIGHAVLDVFTVEPLSDTDLLWNHPAITILPHISAPTNKRTASGVVALNLAAYFATGKIPETVSRKDGY
jgi:glyoxylate/hydroxypyruvate reductase A